MISSVKTFYFYLISIFVLMFLVEAVLEYRHFRLGYTTLIFGERIETKLINFDEDVNSILAKATSNTPLDNSAVEYGPTEKFPFKSKLIGIEKNGAKRIWIASASHAEGGRLSAEDVFPNHICHYLQLGYTCEVINGSDGGMMIRDNVSLLNEYAPDYHPDYAILYQMSMIIAGQQRKLSRGAGGQPPENTGIFDSSGLIKSFQSLALYSRLSDYIGGNIKLAGPLKDSLPADMDDDFEKRVLSFIDACRKNNVKPVIATFAASHDRQNIHKMHFSLRTNFVKYSTYLSPDGWINMVSRYNNLLRHISDRENVPLIDIDKVMNGQYQYFLDFEHFNKQGHLKVASIIGKELREIISQEGRKGGI